jgi:hypothetical protein
MKWLNEELEELERLRTQHHGEQALNRDQIDWLFKVIDEFRGEVVQLKCELSDALTPDSTERIG